MADTSATFSRAHKIWTLGDTGIELQRGQNVSTYMLPAHFHDDYQFMLVETGAREICFRSDRRVFGGNYLTIVNPGETHSTGCHGEHGSSFKTMRLPVSILANNASELGLKSSEPLFPFEVENNYVLRLFSRLHEQVEKDGNSLKCEEMLTEFAEALLVSCKIRRRRNGRRNGDESKIHLVRDYITDNYSSRLTLEELARLTGLSKYHLLRRFSATLGMPPHAFQMRIRINQAKRMLAQGTALKQVATATGFTDASHFGKQFIRLVGFTPRSFQQAVDARQK